MLGEGGAQGEPAVSCGGRSLAAITAKGAPHHTTEKEGVTQKGHCLLLSERKRPHNSWDHSGLCLRLIWELEQDGIFVGNGVLNVQE